MERARDKETTSNQRTRSVRFCCFLNKAAARGGVGEMDFFPSGSRVMEGSLCASATIGGRRSRRNPEPTRRSRMTNQRPNAKKEKNRFQITRAIQTSAGLHKWRADSNCLTSVKYVKYAIDAIDAIALSSVASIETPTPDRPSRFNYFDCCV